MAFSLFDEVEFALGDMPGDGGELSEAEIEELRTSFEGFLDAESPSFEEDFEALFTDIQREVTTVAFTFSVKEDTLTSLLDIDEGDELKWLRVATSNMMLPGRFGVHELPEVKAVGLDHEESGPQRI